MEIAARGSIPNPASAGPTLLLSNMYQRPHMITPSVDHQGNVLDSRNIHDHFEDFYEDFFKELSKYGEIESLNVCDNLAGHMIFAKLHSNSRRKRYAIKVARLLQLHAFEEDKQGAEEEIIWEEQTLAKLSGLFFAPFRLVQNLVSWKS